MTGLRSELEQVLISLLRASEEGGEIALDVIGDAVGVLAVSTSEIDALLARLEHHGRRIVSPAGGAGEAHLVKVVAAVRAIKHQRAGRVSVAQVAHQAGLTRHEVLHALALLRIMQRG